MMLFFFCAFGGGTAGVVSSWLNHEFMGQMTSTPSSGYSYDDEILQIGLGGINWKYVVIGAVAAILLFKSLTSIVKGNDKGNSYVLVMLSCGALSILVCTRNGWGIEYPAWIGLLVFVLLALFLVQLWNYNQTNVWQEEIDAIYAENKLRREEEQIELKSDNTQLEGTDQKSHQEEEQAVRDKRIKAPKAIEDVGGSIPKGRPKVPTARASRL